MFEMVALSSKEICGFVIGKTCTSDYNPWQQNWNVTIPGGKPPIIPVNPPKVYIYMNTDKLSYSVSQSVVYMYMHTAQ